MATFAPPAAPALDLPVYNLASPDKGCDLLEVCTKTGFFALTGHGVEEELLRETWAAAWRFFDDVNSAAGAELRASVQLPDPGYPYGYAPMESERLAASLGDEAAAPDAKETFSIGPLQAPAVIPDDPVARFAFSPNLWPTAAGDEDTTPFQAHMTRYFEAMSTVSAALLERFGEALQAPALTSFQFTNPMSALRLNNYPELRHAPLAGQLRAGAHSDYGTLTVLLPHQDSWVPTQGQATAVAEDGLQVHVGGEWKSVCAPPGTLVVNVGDVLDRVTGGHFKSSLHRVVVPGVPAGTEDDDEGYRVPRRMSLAFFQQPDWDAPLPVLGEERSSTPVTTVGQHIKEKFEAAGIEV